jgi:hypothetical protein
MEVSCPTPTNDIYKLLNKTLPSDISKIIVGYISYFQECIGCKKLRLYTNEYNLCRSCISYEKCNSGGDYTYGVAYFGFEVDPVALSIFLEEYYAYEVYYKEDLDTKNLDDNFYNGYSDNGFYYFKEHGIIWSGNLFHIGHGCDINVKETPYYNKVFISLISTDRALRTNTIEINEILPILINTELLTIAKDLVRTIRACYGIVNQEIEDPAIHISTYSC